MSSALLEALGDYELDSPPPPPKKTPQECAQVNHRILQRLAHPHSPISVSSWAVDILQTLNVPFGSSIVRVTKASIPDTCTVFVLSEETEIITPKSIEGVLDVNTSNLNIKDQPVVTLSEVVDHPLNATLLSCIIRSTIFTPDGGEPRMLVVQYTSDSTVRIPANTLFNALSSQYDVFPAEMFEWFPQPPPLSISQISSPQNTIVALSRRLDQTDDYLWSIYQAYQRTTRMLNATTDLMRRERAKRIEADDVLKDRVGRLHEQVMRNAISLAYGPDWGTEVTITGFTDAVSFVSRGLGKSPLQREPEQLGQALLLKRFCIGMNNFDSNIPDYRSLAKNNDFERLRVEQENLEKRYYEVRNSVCLPTHG